MKKFAVAGLLGLLLTACNTTDQGAAGRSYTDNLVYNSQHPVGHEFQVRLLGFKEPVTAVLKGDVAFVGDIVVGQLIGQRVVAPDKQVIFDLSGDALTPQGTGIVNATGQKWPGGVIPYQFDPGATQIDRDAFSRAKADYDAKTAVRFVPRTNQADYVNVVSKPGCYSYIGRIGGAQDLSLGNGCGVNPARHEMGHAVGLNHEQVRQDRDQWITVNAGGSQNAIDYGSAGTPIGPYDFQSMMHYRNYFVNGRWDYLPKTGFPPERVGNDEVNTFTQGDLDAIATLYGRKGGAVCFFENNNYNGASFCADADSAAFDGFWNDRISSVRVQGGYRVELFNDSNYGGALKTVSGDAASLPDFNDRTSSFRIIRTAAACFYENDNYSGASFCADSGSAWVGDAWNDRVSSVRVRSGFRVELFNDRDYGGSGKTVGGDTASLPDFNDRASSFKLITSTTNPPPPPVGSGGFAKHALIGYWHNFTNPSGSTYPLSEVDPAWDVINVAFAENAQNGNVSFVLDPGAGGEARFIADVRAKRAQGKKVVLSLGGQNGSVTVNNEAEAENFANSLYAILQKYGFDGVDVDLESGVAVGTPILTYLPVGIKKLKAKVGPGFYLSMAPEWVYVEGGYTSFGGPWGAYLPMIDVLRDDLSVLHPQYYNNGGVYTPYQAAPFAAGSADQLVATAKMLIEGFSYNGTRFRGLRPDQVGFGVPSGRQSAGSGFTTLTDVTRALDCLTKLQNCGAVRPDAAYPTFRGVMTWSINWDRFDGFAFSRPVSAHLRGLP